MGEQQDDGHGGLPRVVIVGGGFAGLAAARALGRAPVRLTLVDRSNHHVFQPLLYQVATAGLAVPDIAAPIRQIVRRQRNTTVLLAEVTGVDLAGRRLLLAGDPADAGATAGGAGAHGGGARGAGTELAYDRLILAPGAVPHYFGHPEWAAHAPGLKDCADAVAIRRAILLAYEAAEREPDEARRTRWLTFAIIGGGPTGVELAGALADIARRTLARNFRNFDAGCSRILLVEAGPRLLPTFAPELSRIAAGKLTALGVEVRTGCKVVALDADGIEVEVAGIGTGAPTRERVACGTKLWAAGVVASPLLAALGVPLDRGGRVAVEADLSLPGHPEVLVLGDAAAVRDTEHAQEADDAPAADAAAARLVPGLAPAALQMGQHAARNVERALAGAPTLPFRYRDKGNLATLGRSAAVAQFGRWRFSGPIAWLLWATVHVAYLVGFRNRFVVMFEWTWLWLTQQRGARVIVEPRD
jgi:NADH:ubiquinone reductase (H+-translocating)